MHTHAVWVVLLRVAIVNFVFLFAHQKIIKSKLEMRIFVWWVRISLWQQHRQHLSTREAKRTNERTPNGRENVFNSIKIEFFCRMSRRDGEGTLCAWIKMSKFWQLASFSSRVQTTTTNTHTHTHDWSNQQRVSAYGCALCAYTRMHKRL